MHINQHTPIPNFLKYAFCFLGKLLHFTKFIEKPRSTVNPRKMAGQTQPDYGLRLCFDTAVSQC